MKLLYALLSAFDGKNLSHTTLLKRNQKVEMISSVISLLSSFFFQRIVTVCL